MQDIIGDAVPSSNPDLGAYQNINTVSDKTAPTLVSASINSPTSVILLFSEKVNSIDAANKSNYSVNNGITVSAAALSTDGTQVTLTTSANKEGQTNIVVVS